ncbi:hypothetical protein ACJMK2_033043, partial [Sinanodonta woodiana]
LFAMEGHVFALQMLLMLLGTAYIASACFCIRRTFDSYLCDSESSVIRARVISAEIVNQDGKPLTDEEKNDTFFMMNMIRIQYVMQLQKTFQTGSNEISTSNSCFQLIKVRSDGPCVVVLNTDTDYLLS